MTETEGQTPPAPSSTLLTFLLADIRGFTAYTDASGDEAGARLSEQFLALCREVVSSFDGQVFGSAGDQALAAFPSARQALRAAVALQRRLTSEQEAHPEIPLQAGIGLDTGDAVQVGGDYRGGAINLAARLCSLAGKGEIFASEGVIKTARKTEGISFLDRGEVHVKGIEGAVRVLQIAPEGELPEDLPPLQPLLVTSTHNLPDEPTPFVGRETEIADVAALLRGQHVRLVTLTGPGGTGKTRLAVQVGAHLVPDFPQGVYFVSLDSFSDAELVPSAIATTLGLKEAAGQSLIETLISYLHDKRLLLVLDNFEHLLDAAPFVADLLARCPQLTVLATSRAILHLAREHEYPVPSLAVPDPQHLPDLATLSQYDAVRLFIERVQAVKPGFQVTNDNAPAVAEICSRLDGLPLALELAAARVRLFPPQALLQRLQSRLGLLTGGARDRPSRQQTLRGAIEWSYDLLSPEEQTLFARIPVFAGGCTFEAAEAVCSPEGELDLLEGMTSLVEKSLLRQEGEEEPRFRMLETIREYAAEKLAERRDAGLTKQRHAKHFLAMAVEAQPHPQGGEQTEWLDRLERERDNLRAALEWLLAHDPAGSIRLAVELGDYWWGEGYVGEGRRWLERAIERGEEVDATLRERAWRLLGLLALLAGRLDEAERAHQQALAVARQMGDTRRIAVNLMSLANVLAESGDESAPAVVDEALRILERLEEPLDLAQGHLFAGLVRELLEDYGGARAHHQQSLQLFRQADNSLGEAAALGNLGNVAFAQAEYETAARLHREALENLRPGGGRNMVPECLEAVAAIASVTGRPARAARLFAAGEAAHEAFGTARSRVHAERVLRHRDEARAQAGEAAWSAAWEEGRAMTLEQAVSYALEEGSAF